jgi:hypothetical protein
MSGALLRGVVVLLVVVSLGSSKGPGAQASEPSALAQATSAAKGSSTHEAASASTTSTSATPSASATPASGAPFWPRFHGPKGDNISTDTGLLKQWPDGGPKLLWTAKGLGHGFVSVSLAGGLIYTAGNQDGKTARRS